MKVLKIEVTNTAAYTTVVVMPMAMILMGLIVMGMILESMDPSDGSGPKSRFWILS